jgi:hypothetical protein
MAERYTSKLVKGLEVSISANGTVSYKLNGTPINEQQAKSALAPAVKRVGNVASADTGAYGDEPYVSGHGTIITPPNYVPNVDVQGKRQDLPYWAQA